MDSNFCVTRSERTLVTPCEQTPPITLHLSPIDSLPVLRCNARTLHVFRDAPPHAAPGAVIREALSRALVPYYPLAGRLLKQPSHHNPLHLQLDCSSQGVLFAEASSTSTLRSLNYFDDLTSIPFHQLLPDQADDVASESEPLVQMQVTQFACGGFVMGLLFCHSICDGLGAAQFLNAVGELARGVERLSVTPTWHRDFFPPPPPNANANANATAFPNLPPPVPDYSLQHSNIDIPIDHINRLKKQFHESTGKTCSAFEIVAASFWRCRTRAVYEDEQLVKLVFFANCRQLVEPPLPKGFYGNCFFPVTISGCSRSIGEASINEVVKLIQEEKSKVGSEFVKYMKGEHGEDPFAPPLKYTTLFLSEWGRLGFNEIDYGWGPPVHVVPIQGSAVIPVGIVGSLPLPKKGIRLMTWCVEEHHRRPFLHQMSQLLL